MSVRDRWGRVWPALLAVVVVGSVGTPAAVASYRHARDVVISTGDTVMAPWLPLSVDGMLLAALVVMWVRRHRGDAVGKGPWAAFVFGMLVTVAANLEAVNIHPTPLGPPDATDYIVALFPPLALAIALELVALVAKRTAPAAAKDDRSQRSSDRSTVADLVAQTTAAAVREPVTEAVQMTAPGPVHVPAEMPDLAPASGPVHVVDEAVQMPADVTGPLTDELPAVVTAEPVEMDRSEPVRMPAVVTADVTDEVPVEVTEVDRSDQDEHDDEPVQTTGPVTDEQVLEWLQVKAAADRKVPGRAAVIKEWSIGATRADRLRGQVTVPRRLKRVQ